jgi:GAF domain-containing protein
MITPSSPRGGLSVTPAVHRRRTGLRRRPQLDAVGRHHSAAALGQPMQEALDRVTYLTGQALDAPAVCVSLVDAERRLLASSYGMPVPTALLISHAFRKHIVASSRPLVVADGRRDPLVAQNPVVRDGTVRACVGIPFGTADGRTIGTLLAMDPRPRRWTAPQLDLLDKLSALIVSEVEVEAAVRRTWRSEVSLPTVNQYGGQS